MILNEEERVSSTNQPQVDLAQIPNKEDFFNPMLTRAYNTRDTMNDLNVVFIFSEYQRNVWFGTRQW